MRKKPPAFPPPPDLDEIQRRLGHVFRDPELPRRALTHPSLAQERDGNTDASNQRLEFLGDAVLQLILAEALYRERPGDREGDLSKHRAALVKGARLSEIALGLGLDHHLLLGAGEEQTGGRRRPAALEDALEALVGAVYLDSDYPTTRRVVLALYGGLSAQLPRLAGENPKGRLQEIIQRRQPAATALRYETRHASGADHAREYESVLHLNGTPLATGRGSSKKSAEESAALAALEKLGRP
ncbi:MAG: ribonuclease III [Opitutaceae bacterium]|jgi:ribonuclease-3|nr:ribonuclease III [Opitutaceae bacterium]